MATAPPLPLADTNPIDQHRNARLVRALLLGMIVIFGSLDTVSALTAPDYRVPWIGYLFLFTAFLFNSRGFHRVAVGSLIALVPLVVLGTWNRPQAGAHGLYYLVFAELTASLLLRVRATLLVAVGCVVIIGLAATVLPGASGFAAVRGQFLVVTLSAVLVLVTMVHRDGIERDRQAALRAGVERYHALFDKVPVALAEEDLSAVRQFLDTMETSGVADLNQRFSEHPEQFDQLVATAKRIDVNEYWIALFGPNPDATGGPFSEAGGLDLRRSVAALFIGLREHGREDERELAIEVAPGERRFVRMKLMVRAGSELTWDRVLLSAVDVTESRRAQESLRISEVRLRTIVATALDPIVSMDHRGNTIDFNPAAERVFGYARAQVIGRPLEALIVPPVHREAHHEGIARFLSTGEARILGRRVELTAMRSDGSEFPCELAITASTLDHPPTFTAHLRDLTERAEAEARHAKLEVQLRQAQKMEAVGQLAGGVAHDFNNSLQAVSGYLSFASEEATAGGSPELMADLHEAQVVVGRAAELTRQLLTFSRQQTLSLQTVPLDDVLVAVLKLLRRVLGEQIDVRYRPTSGLPPVRVDTGQMEQAVLNLCLNARDAMPKGGTLTLSTDLVILDATRTRAHPAMSPGSHVRLSVTDTGSGMDPTVLSRMFEPFFTTKEAGRGTGLGLAVVYGVVEQHHGLIEAESKVGVGTVFRIHLPASGDPLRTTTSVSTVTSRRGTETILLADDDAAIRHVVERFLLGAGYRVLTASSGSEAESVFRANAESIAIVLLDAVMPGQSGRAAYERIAQIRPGMPVIFCSGYSSDILDADWLESVGATLVHKPFDRQVLLSQVRAVLDAAALQGVPG